MGLFNFFSRKKTATPQKPKPTSQDLALLEPVEVMPGLQVPRAFAQHWAEIETTRLPFIKITATPATSLTPEQSSFGYYPCLPAGFDYPKDAEGRYMYPLAQIRCNKLPALPGYPKSGYLQFYISAFDDVYGLNFDNLQSQENFRVLYFEEQEVQDRVTDFSFLDEVMESGEVPVDQPHALTFSMAEEYLGLGDVRSEKDDSVLNQVLRQYPSITDQLHDAAHDYFLHNGHKIGGYAGFTQTDPRIYKDGVADYLLLFQLDSDKKIMWGDMGVANFFIHPDDLAKKDFSRVMYNWDCC